MIKFFFKTVLFSKSYVFFLFIETALFFRSYVFSSVFQNSKSFSGSNGSTLLLLNLSPSLSSCASSLRLDRKRTIDSLDQKQKQEKQSLNTQTQSHKKISSISVAHLVFCFYFASFRAQMEWSPANKSSVSSADTFWKFSYI